MIAVTSGRSLRLLGQLPDRWARSGWDVHVVSGGDDAGNRWGSGVTQHVINMERDPAPMRDLAALGNWLRLLRRVRPDVLVAGTPKAGLLGMIAARAQRVPVRVYHLRGLRLESETGPRRAVLSGIERLTSAAATDVLAISESLRREYVRLGLATDEKVSVLGAGSSHGVDVEKFTPDDRVGTRADARRRFGIPLDALLVGFVGRVTADKGIDVLLEAFNRLPLAMGAHLAIIGPTEGPAAAELLRLVQLEGSPRIHLLGFQSDVEAIYPALDLLCLPSYREGFGNVVLEAALAEVPAIASDVTGLRDSVCHGKTGILVPAGDASELAGALQRVVSDPPTIRRLGACARRRAIDLFDQETVAAAHDAYFTKLLAGSQNVGA
jgi:glycosyltransferase involved in cell wall biosynthesis